MLETAHVAALPATQWIGYRVDDVHGARIGRVAGTFVDHATGRADWLLVRLAGLTQRHAAVPVAEATAGGRQVRLFLERHTIRLAPPVSGVHGLTARTERELCAHYGLDPTRGANLEVWQDPEITAVLIGDPADTPIAEAA